VNRRCVAALALSALVAAPTAAGAPSGQGAGGGAEYVATPKVAKVSCLRRCAARKRAQSGSVLKLRGRDLGGVTEVIFLGSYGKDDDTVTTATAAREVAVRARVPIGAVTGPIAVATANGMKSSPTRPIAIMPPPPPDANAELTPVPGPRLPGAPMLETGTSRTKAYVDARRAVTFSFRVSDTTPSALTVELVRAADGAVVKSWSPENVVPGQVQSVTWNGRVGQSAAETGRYSFRLTAAGSDGAIARNSQTGDVQRDAFDLYDHIFPIRASHDFGSAGSRFGSGRAGHSHQGHDLFAKCGARMVAARGGKVQYSGYHSAAGNYLVIDGAGSSLDYVYMHLAEPSAFRAGDRVYTGQRIGSVGETGNAQGCHLHFELWASPGWYEGGRPFDPFPALRAWDSWS
jgi:murein DD-endopeptidase MepM/ murein hydrolase activator NlpD